MTCFPEVTCPVPPAVPNAMYHFDPYSSAYMKKLDQEGQRVRFDCIKGFEMVDDTIEPVLTCKNGQWVGPIPTCGQLSLVAQLKHP